jgi:UDP-N-acetyl-D-mannosaminuronic acid dehydrogenase
MTPLLDKKICVIGLGYIGLPTAAVLASRGYTVHGVEVNEKAVKIINSGKAHVVEPDLDLLVQAAVQTGKLKAHASPPDEADIFMICVPTPVTEEHGPDLSYVHRATETICPSLKKGNLIVLESTSPPGTTEAIAKIVEEKTGLTKDDVHFAHAPERVLPGRILREVVENDRIIGGINDASTQACAEFYRTFVTGELLLTHCRMAETAKLVENASRDVQIAFANELSLLADDLQLDVWELIDLANRHPRVNILKPGCGVGGHCIAVDPWFLVHQSPATTKLIRTARDVNNAKPHWVVSKVRDKAAKFKHPTIACLGLAYKPDIDDLRESPAADIVRELRKANIGDLKIVEPNLASHEEFPLTPLDEALAAADIIVLLVAHRPFRKIPVTQLAEKIVIDTCGALRG